MADTRTGIKGGRLDTEVIVQAGLELARLGKPLTVRALGTSLGADPTAIYRHFRNKDELMKALLDRVMQLAHESVTVSPADWRAYLRESVEATVRTFAHYPAIGVEAPRLSTGGAGEQAATEGLLTAFRHAGLSGSELVRHYMILSGHVLTFASLAARTGGEEPWLDRPITFSADVDASVAALRPELEAITERDIREQTVELVIESAERAAAGDR